MAMSLAGAPAVVLPQRRQPIIPNGVAAMLMFVGAEIMFFAGLVSAFLIIKAGTTQWPPLGQPRLPIAATAVNTTILLLSGFVLAVAHRVLRKNPESPHLRRLLVLAMGSGAFFVVFQGREWVHLIRFGLTMTSSNYGSFFYMIVGVHALHAVAALGGLGFCTLQQTRGRLSSTQFLTAEVFWYFVVGIWPILYGVVYLT